MGRQGPTWAVEPHDDDEYEDGNLLGTLHRVVS
jgi:hypothetical protein